MSGMWTINNATPKLGVAGSSFFIDHITANFMHVLYKLSLADRFVVTEKYERIWDYDSMQEINDLVGYNLWYTE